MLLITEADKNMTVVVKDRLVFTIPNLLDTNSNNNIEKGFQTQIGYRLKAIFASFKLINSAVNRSHKRKLHAVKSNDHR